MSETLIIWAAAASAVTFAAAITTWLLDGASSYRRRLSGRVRASSEKEIKSDQASLFTDEKSADGGLSSRLERLYEASGIKLSLERYLIGITVGAVAAALAALFVTRTPWTSIPAFAAVIIGGVVWVAVRRRDLTRKMTMQVPKALDVISRAVRAGQTVPAAFQIVGDDLQSPLAEEFRRCYEQQNLGISFESSLRSLAKRTGVMELRILVVALLVQSRSGGNLVDILNNLSATMQKRIKLEQRVRALTGEGRMQANILIVLPTLAFVVLYVLAPKYIATLLDHPKVIAAAVAAQSLGAIWIRRCIRIAY